MRFAPSAERFARAYSVDAATGCWLWSKSVDTHGYGLFRGPEASFRQAHRWSWLLHVGPIPEGKWALHKCDNRRCVNPEHLYIGDVVANSRDRAERAPRRPIVLRPREAHLTGEQIIAIRNDRRAPADVGADYHVSPRTVEDIVSGARWYWI